MVRRQVTFHILGFLYIAYADRVSPHDPLDRTIYSKEWHFRNPVKTIRGDAVNLNENNPTSSEPSSTFQNGWRPLVMIRNHLPHNEKSNLNKFRDTKPTQLSFRSIEYKPTYKPSHSISRSKIKPKLVINIKHQPISVSVIDNLPKIQNFNKTLQPAQIHYMSPSTVDRIRRVKNLAEPPKKKPKLILEDDLMWMYYGPPVSREPIPKFRPFGHIKELKVRPRSETERDVNDSDDMLMQEKTNEVVYTPMTTPAPDEPYRFGRQNIGFTYPFTSTTASLSSSTARATYSKNIYEIIDKNNKDDFKPILGPSSSPTKLRVAEDAASRATFTQHRLEEQQSYSGDDHLWQDISNVFDGDIANEHPTVDFNLVHVGDNPDQHHMAGGSSTETSAIPQDNSVSHVVVAKDEKHERKFGKLFNKPIVITEPEIPTSTDGEYYRQLFDSFGNHQDNNEYKQKIVSSTFIVTSPLDQYNSTTAATAKNIDRNDDEYSRPTHSSNETLTTPLRGVICTSEHDDSCTSGHIVSEKKILHKEDETWNFLYNLAMIGFTDLLPKTLKSNIFLVKRLMFECSSDFEGSDSNGNTFSCIKKITFKVLDKAVNSDLIKISDTVSLVKENQTDLQPFRGRLASGKSGPQQTDWLPHLIDKVRELFSTHSLKIQLMSPQENGNLQVEGRRRHYRRVFPIMVGAYMILSTVLIPLGFKFMILLGGKSLLISKLSLLIATMGGIKKFMGFGNNDHSSAPQTAHYSPYYPPLYPSYPSYYDPWRRDEFRKISHNYDYPTEYSHYTEEVE